MTEEQVEQFFRKLGVKATLSHYDAGKRNVWYASIGEDRLPALLFIHGAPASMTMYKNFYKDEALLKRFTIYAIDRPGYGLSGKGHPVPSIQKQAAMLFPLVERIHRVHQPLMMVGASYGASIACRLAIDFPGLAQGLVLIAPAVGPKMQRSFGMNRLLLHPYFKKFLPAEILSAAIEKREHEKQLRKMLPLWKKVHIPVYCIQSENDLIVSASNISFLEKHLKPGLLHAEMVKGWRHDIVAKAHPMIRSAILELFNRLN